MKIDDMTIGEARELAAMFGGKTEHRKSIKDGGIKIVVLQRGWVAIGRFSQEGQDCKLTNAGIIRIWGTTKGITELVEGPASKTIIDKTNKPITFHELTVVLMLDAEEKAWSKIL